MHAPRARASLQKCGSSWVGSSGTALVVQELRAESRRTEGPMVPAGKLLHMLLAAIAAARAAVLAAASSQDVCFNNLPPEPTSLFAPWLPTKNRSVARQPHQHWLRSAMILQPWGVTQFELVANATRLAPLLAERFGFNTIILLPAPAHLSYCAIDGPCGLTAEEIAAGADAFRANGWWVIMYTSYMHVGEARVWTNGSLNAAHPSWAQRNASGAPWKFEGANSPLSPCSAQVLNYTINYAVGQYRAMHAPDATMLDNNEMGPLTWGCASSGCGYEPVCADAFNTYARARFNAYILQTCFGISSNLPIKPPPRSTLGTPLYGLWVHWRNLVMASLNRRFDTALRLSSSSGVGQLFANTAIDWPDFSLAQDLQYQSEDAVLTEVYDTDPMSMHFLLSLGAGVAELSRSKTFIAALYQNQMKAVQLAPQELHQVMLSTIAHHARPWLVFESNMLNMSNPSAKTLQRVHKWLTAEAITLTDGMSVAPVACMSSAATRNFRPAVGVAITPKRCLRRAAELGAPARVIFEEGYNDENDWLQGIRLLVLDGVRCLPRGAILEIVRWAAAGGSVLMSTDAGQCDGLGRTVPTQDRLSSQLNGLRTVTIANISSDSAEALLSAESWVSSSDNHDGTPPLVLPYSSASGLTIFVLRGQSQRNRGNIYADSVNWLLRIPSNNTLAPTARLTAPGNFSRRLTIFSSGHGIHTVQIPADACACDGFAVIVQSGVSAG